MKRVVFRLVSNADLLLAFRINTLPDPHDDLPMTLLDHQPMVASDGWTETTFNLEL